MCNFLQVQIFDLKIYLIANFKLLKIIIQYVLSYINNCISNIEISFKKNSNIKYTEIYINFIFII